MMKVAVPNKGALSVQASQMLQEAGYRQRRDTKELVLTDEDNDVEFFYLRPRDIAIYVGEGTVDVGITGRDLLLDSQAGAREEMELGFGSSTFRFAAAAGRFNDVRDLAGARIATSYPIVVQRHLDDVGVAASIVHLDGAVETAVRLGVADAIADVVETGTTLRNAGLQVFGDPLLRSSAVLIRRRDAESHAAVEVLKHRLTGVLVAHQYVLMDYDIPLELLQQACTITPGFESPTVTPLHDPAWVAVRSMVTRETTHQVMDELYELGARAILVTTIHACRL